MRAHIYLRVSTEEQAEEGFSLQAQERACRLFCELHDYQVAGLYCDEGYSGTVAERPQFRQLVTNVQPHQVVVVHKLDRLARNTHLLLETLQRWDAQQVRLLSVSEQIDFSSPIGKVILTILSAFAQYYVDNLRSETIKGLKEKAQRGLWVGPVPYGYRKSEQGYLLASEDAPVVGLMFELYATGEYSYTTLAAALNERSLQMYDWQTRERHSFMRESVRVILKNRAYLGFVSSGGIEYEGLHAPLVSSELWEACNLVRAGRDRPGRPGSKPASWLQGRVWCALCGAPLWFATAGRNDYRAFRCSGRRQRGCTAPQIRAVEVERQVGALLELLVLPLDAVDQVFMKVWCEGEQVVALTPTGPYRGLLQRLGYRIK